MNLPLVLLLTWAGIHGVHYVLKGRNSEALLPTARGVNPLDRQLRARFWNTRTTQVVLNKLHIRVQTSAWNVTHDALSKALLLRPRSRLRAHLTHFYNVGCAVGVLGTFLSLGLLLWTVGDSIVPIVHAALRPPTPPSSSALLLKRGLEEAAGRSAVIKPIIPGVTVPLGHLPSILLAVFLSQIIHELGHAVSAALDAVPVMTAGASFTVVVPAAFVTFPATALESLKPFARSRIIAAGPFHNLVFWCLLLFVERIGAGDLITSMMYRDVSDVGRVVVKIDEDSDLRGHLPIGSVVTKLDDTSLGTHADQWTAYLTTTQRPPDLGWCVDRAVYLGNSQSCCEPHATFSPLTCFVAVSSSAEKGCVDAIPILTGKDEQRCRLDLDCAADALQCVRPDESANILRLGVYANGQDEVVLWSGPLAEVYEQVDVGKLFPRFRLLPLWIYTSTRLFWVYLKMATMSLYLFNLLPLPYLDGAQFIHALSDMTLHAGSAYDEYDIEALAASTSNRGRWKERLAKSISVATLCLFVLSTILAMTHVR
ncbi:hypothetical protein B0H15DRAFT_850488 [Mycena belliarum]|uniref:Endopeptidase S2P n=1 Tax=Mycena belliarum TaxID=1033014 RepID=A0AAD6XNN4_9AGAR|nr:hypothetical protein B0H15DRAFT_850488 [Mycena belliae]